VFSTILKEITGFFDRRALVSTFFPSLAFWMGALLALLVVELGVDTTLAAWQRQPGTVQALLVAGFLVLVAFWSLLLLSLRDAVERLYQGIWPTTGLIGRLGATRCQRWRQPRAELIEEDQRLEHEEVTLFNEQQALRSPETLAAGATHPGPADDQFDDELASLESLLQEVHQRPAAAAGKVAEMAERTSWLLRSAQPDPTSDSAPFGPLAVRLERLSSLYGRLEEAVEQHLQRVREERYRLQEKRFLQYPQPPVDVMPTRLGNVLAAVEQYPRERYWLDPVVVWPRLQPLLPPDFAGPLQDAKTSLDFGLTLSSFVWLFGVPIALWVAVRAAWLPGSLLLYMIAGVALVCGVALAVRLRRVMLRALAILVPLAAAATFVVSLRLGADSPIPTAVVRAEAFVLVAAALLLAALAINVVAVQAAISYGERIKAAFDLHRWKVLQELQLQLPPDWQEERQTWRSVCQFLYRGLPPDAERHRYVVSSLTRTVPASTVRAWVPARDLPPYRAIGADQLEQRDVDESELPTDPADHDELVGRCPLVQLAAHRPVAVRLLVASEQLDGMVAVGLPEGARLSLPITVEVGDVVDLMVTRQGRWWRQPESVEFNDLLVLEVVRAAASGDDADAGSQCQGLVVGLPLARRTELTTADHDGSSVVVTRRLPRRSSWSLT
jgi:hypothetical protein